MRKIAVLLTIAMCTVSAFAWHHPHHHHHCGPRTGWAAAGIGMAAGIVGAALYNSVAPREPVVVTQPAPVVVQPTPVVVQQPTTVVVQQPAPVVVQQPAPVVVQQPAPTVVQTVWVDGRYVQQVQPNGTVVQVWQPGHYEQR